MCGDGQVDSYEFNKIAGWVLAALIAVLGLSIVTKAMFPVHNPQPTAYEVQGVEAEGAAGGAPAEAAKPIAFYLQKADPKRGEAQFKKCAACHTIDKGGPAGIGPNLYGILGLPHAHMAGFGYSSAMAATHDKKWDWENLSHWIENPKSYIPGNKMSFAGLSKPQDRADVLVYLNSKSDSPLPLPAAPAEDKPAAAEATAAEAPAAGAPGAAPAEAKGANAGAATAPAAEKAADAKAAAPAAPAE